MLEVEVCEVREKIPCSYIVGDKISIDSPRILLEKTDTVAFMLSHLCCIMLLL